ncbi:MAG: hypothetical protein MJK12_13335 [Colwellia sp.]|nr:hypothetical protein [Colwellia sp.]
MFIGIQKMKDKIWVIAWLIMGSLITSCGGDSSVTPPPPPPTTKEIPEPAFEGSTISFPDLIIDSDPSTYVALDFIGMFPRRMWDSRVESFIEVRAHVFTASFDDNLSVELAVNPEFSSEEARLSGEKYLHVFGQIPYDLRRVVNVVWLNKGNEHFVGGFSDMLIHSDRAEQYIEQGILAETFIHEAAHSLRGTAQDPWSFGWSQAVTDDYHFITPYAQEVPSGEDIPESIVPYIALRYKPDRISQQDYDTIMEAIPNRIDVFDKLELNIYPMIE